jgi:predicted DNA-binding transcriptional regulator AlpA
VPQAFQAQNDGLELTVTVPVRPYPPDFVAAETLAYRLDCSRSTIDAYVRAGLLPKPETIGNLQRWDFVEVRAFIKAQNAILSEDVASEEDAFFKGLESGSPKKGKR